MIPTSEIDKVNQQRPDRIIDALNRVIREVRKAKPDWEKTTHSSGIVKKMIDKDMEVRVELELLIQTIIEVDNG